jgi:type I restriction enzyme S subunit
MSFDLPALPQDWSYASLESCSQPNSVTYGVVQPGSALEAGKPLIRVNNFRGTRIDLADVMYIAPEIEAKYSRTRLKGGEVLVTVVGSVGQVAVVPSRFAGFNVARAVAVIHPLPHIAPEWIALCLRSPLSQHLLGSRANTTVQTTINLKDLRALPIPLPPEDERCTIAEFVGALDDRITLLRETNTTLEAIAQALFKSWFVDFDPVRAKLEGSAPEGADEANARLFPDSFEESELGLVPTGWRVGTIESVAERVGMGPFGSNIKVETFVETGVPVISGQHLKQTLVEDNTFNFVTIEHANRLSKSCVQHGDVIFTHAGSIGQVSMLHTASLFERYVLSQRQFFLRCDLAVLPPEWAIYFFSSPLGQHLLLANASQVGVPSIARPVTYLRSIKIVVPPLPLTQKFAETADSIHHRVMANRHKLQTLATLRDTLLPRLISGALRLPIESKTDK